MNKLLDSLTSGFVAEYDATARDVELGDPDAIAPHRMTLEMYAFLLQWFVTAAERVKSKNDEDAPSEAPRARRGRGGKTAASRNAPKKDTNWTWVDQIPNTLAAISKVLRVKSKRVWTESPELDNFIK